MTLSPTACAGTTCTGSGTTRPLSLCCLRYIVTFDIDICLSNLNIIYFQLCHLAQTWANHLAHTNRFYYRNDKDIGQNLFCRATNVLVTDVTGQEVTTYWYSAVKQYDFRNEPDRLRANVNAGK